MKVSLRSVVAMTIADIEIFLLLSEDQTKDNDKETFTRQEIKEQLSKTAKKMGDIFDKCDYDSMKPIKNRSGKIVYYSVEDETSINPNNIHGLT